MKIIILASIILMAVASLSSCTKACTCSHQCNVFNNGSIIYCQSKAITSSQFINTTDSLAALYGSYSSYYRDSIYVSGSSSTAIDAIDNQLEQQGYSCKCFY